MIEPLWKRWIYFAIIFAIGSATLAAEPIARSPKLPETTPWDLQKLSDPPAFEWVDSKGPVRSLLYDGESYRGKPTRVFAYYATPGPLTSASDPKKDKKLPAVVLIHGGGGTAFREWAELWAKRGYAAIAMDLAGHRPVEGKNPHQRENRERMPDGGPDQGDETKFGAIDEAPTEQWPYHAVAAAIRAHSLIRSFPEIDTARTAVTGISWGGYLTSIVAGVDSRFKAAVPVYGCGFLHENSAWLDRFSKMTPAQRDRWVTLWDPSRYLPAVSMPILFVNGTNDFAYPLDSYMRSYDAVSGTKQLCITVNMPHSHPAGWAPSEIGIFIDQHLKGELPLPVLADPVNSQGKIRMSFASQVKLVDATLHLTTETGPINKRNWQSHAAKIDGYTAVSDVSLKDTTAWFLTVKDERGAVVSTRVRFHPQVLMEADAAVPMSDGTILRANIFRPDQRGSYPVLVMRTPYGKPNKVDESLVRAGFIVVTQDARGRYSSDGSFESFLRSETHDAKDGQDTVEWAAKLPDSNGKVGLYGSSYNAFLAWRAASTRPKSLAAMAAFSIPARYTDLEGPGTIRPGRRLKWWHGSISPDLRRKTGGPPPHTNADANRAWESGEGDKLLQFLPWRELPDELFGTESAAVKSWLDEPWRDPWKLALDAENATVPNLNVCGWYDHCNGSIDLHLAIAGKGGSFTAKRHSRLIVGPWSHSSLGKRKQGEIDFGPTAEVDLNQLNIDWFGHWLRGDQNDVERWAPVRVFVMGANEWRNFYEWPPKYSTPRQWFLDSDGSANSPQGNGRLATQPATTEQRDHYDYDPRIPVPTLWTPALFTVPADQAPLAARKDILVYQTPRLTEDVEVIGYPEVVLHAASSCADTDFFVRLIDVSANGRTVDLASGMVRARYRQSLEQPQLLVPGEPTEFHIRMRPTAHRFLAGHRIRLDVTSSDFPNYDRNHNTPADQNKDKELVVARQSILHDPAHLSRLILPVMRKESTVPHWAEGAVSVPPPTFVKEWGELGNLSGQLHSPIGIAIDSLDRLYVTEFKNKRVQVFDNDGNTLATFAVPAEPGGIAVDKEHRVYVSSMTAHKVWVFDPSGNQTQEWGRNGAGDGEFNQPGGMAIGLDGAVYVVDQANHRIQQFTPEGKFVAKWGEFGSAAGQFGGDGPKGSRLSGPHFCAFDREGRLYTTEGANLRIQRFKAGQAQGAWIGAGSEAGCFGGRPKDRTNPFEGPIAIAIDAQGRVWVSSTNNRVQCFTADGKFVTGVGDEGNEPGKFIIPHGLAFDSKGFLYVVDASNQRIQKFKPN